MELIEALQQLDPDDDFQWTKTGGPALSKLGTLVGRVVTRADIEEIAPGFNRTRHRAALAAVSHATVSKPDATAPTIAPAPPSAETLPSSTADPPPPDNRRYFLYHASVPQGRLFEGSAIDEAVSRGWVDSPAGFKA